MFRYSISVLALCAAVPAAADLSDVAQLDIIPGWTASDGTQIAGLDIRLAPGWKTYWRAPGAGGIPPVISFEGSDNIATAQFRWPVPEVFEQNGMQSVGYMGGVVLPIELAPLGDGPMHLSGSILIGVCEEVCIPVTMTFDMPLPQSDRRDPALLAAILDRPMTAEEAGVRASTCKIEPISDGLKVTATVTAPSTGGNEAMVVEIADKTVWVSEAYTKRDGRQISGVVDMVSATGEAFALDRSAIRITIIGNDSAIDIQGCSAG